MDFQLSEIPIVGVGYGLAGIIVAALLFKASRRSGLDAIPTVGSSTWLGSMWAGLKYPTNASKVIQEGYDQYKSSPFKVATPHHWIVVTTNREHVEEILRASDDDLSAPEATDEQFHFACIFPQELIKNDYHMAVIRSHLTRSIGMMCAAIKDEMTAAFNDILELKGNEWQSVPMLSSMQNVVCRTSNRMFVGLPLCRDPDWIDLNVKFTIDVFMKGVKLGLFPALIRPLVAPLFREVERGLARGIKLLRPVYEERLEFLSEYGKEGDDMPSDLLSWLMKEANVPFTLETMTLRVLSINLAAIFTTSNSLTSALFYLAGNPQYVQPLREEVEAIVEAEGWSKAALAGMHKVDSFLKESQRVGGSDFVSLMRKAMKDYTFADGTFIPKGTLVGVGVNGVHFDDKVYDNAREFEPFRFVNTEKTDGDAANHRFVTTGVDYLPFGHGKHACPGRFFGTNELKCLLAHVVMTYDVKLEDGKIPPITYFGPMGSPDPHARLLFKKRID